MKLLVTGASGVLGREVLIAAQSTGIAVRAISRRPAPGHTGREEWMQADLATGQGIDEAVRGCDAIVHAASDPRHADAVDVDGTRRLTGGRRPRIRPAPDLRLDRRRRSGSRFLLQTKAGRGADRRPGRRAVLDPPRHAVSFVSRPAHRAGGPGAARPAGSRRIRHPACRGVRGGRTADAVHRRRTARPGHRLRRTRSALVPRGGGAVATGAAHEQAHRADSRPGPDGQGASSRQRHSAAGRSGRHHLGGMAEGTRDHIRIH